MRLLTYVHLPEHSIRLHVMQGVGGDSCYECCYNLFSHSTGKEGASLLGARTLLGAPGLTTRNKKLLVTRAFLLVARSY